MTDLPVLSPFQFLDQMERFFLKALTEDESLKTLSIDNQRIINFEKECSRLDLWMEVTPKAEEAPPPAPEAEAPATPPAEPAEGEQAAPAAEETTQEPANQAPTPEETPLPRLERIAFLEIQGVPQKGAKSAYQVTYSLALNEKEISNFVLVEDEGDLNKEAFKAAAYLKAYLTESVAGQLESAPESFPTAEELKEQITKDLEAAIASGAVVVKEKKAPAAEGEAPAEGAAEEAAEPAAAE